MISKRSIPPGLYYSLSMIGVLLWVQTGSLIALATGSVAMVIGIVKDNRLYPKPQRRWYRGKLTGQWYETK